MSWYIEALKKYAVFSGRSSRREYWFFTLFNVIAAVVLIIIDSIIGSGGLLTILYGLAVLVPALAVTVRRLHDTDRSGWWVLIWVIPLGGLVLLVFALLDSTPGDNGYGPNPKSEREKERQSRRLCSSCGTEIRPGNAFCVSCGKGLTTENGASREAPATLDSETLKRTMQGAQQRAKKAYEQANVRYKEYNENQALQRERQRELQAIERECDDLRAGFEGYEAFFRKAYTGSVYFLDWWRAYESGEGTDSESRLPDLLSEVRERSEAGLSKVGEMKEKLPTALGDEDPRKESRHFLNGLRVNQENFQGGESVFPPLVEIHKKLKDLEGWARYREELEQLLKDLEDLLGSSVVRTAAASRARYPDPSGRRENEGSSCTRCGQRNSPLARYCFSCGELF